MRTLGFKKLKPGLDNYLQVAFNTSAGIKPTMMNFYQWKVCFFVFLVKVLFVLDCKLLPTPFAKIGLCYFIRKKIVLQGLFSKAFILNIFDINKMRIKQVKFEAFWNRLHC